MDKFKIVLKNELKQIGKDNLMLMMALYPVLLAVIGRYAVPYLRIQFLSESFDLGNHYNLVVVFIILATPYIYGALSAFMLLDEREQGSLQAIQITPISIEYYLGVKVVIMTSISFVTGVLLTLFIQLIEMTLGEAILINGLIALSMPFNMMLVNYLAKNKVEGFAAVKGTGLLIMLPMLVYYVPRQLNFILGIIPGYWPAMAIGAINGHGYATMPYWLYGVIGCVYIIGLCMILLKGFKKKIMV